MAATGSSQSSGSGTYGHVGSTDWNNPTSVASLCRYLWGQRRYKWPWEKKAYRNIYWLDNQQYHRWSREGERFESDPTLPKHQLHLVYNCISPLLEQRVSKLVRNNSVWDPPPATSADEDMAVARIAKDVLRWYWTDGLNMPAILRRALRLCMSTATCFLEVQWDPTGGDPIVLTPDSLVDYAQLAQNFKFPQQQMPAPLYPEGANPNGLHPGISPTGGLDPDPMAAMPGFANYDVPQHVQAQAQQDFGTIFGDATLKTGRAQRFTGDVRVNVHPMFNVIWWPFDVADWKDVRRWMITTKHTAPEVAGQFGVDVAQVREWASGKDVRQYIEQRAGWGRTTRTDAMVQADDGDAVIVHRIFTVPESGMERGKLAVVIGDTCIKGPMDSPYREVPIVPLTDIPIPEGPVVGTCCVTQAIHPQKDLNLSISQESNDRNMRINNIVVRFMGDMANDKGFSTAPNSIIKVSSPSLMPKLLERPALGVDNARAVERDLQFIHDIMGVSSVDLGRTQSDGQSGRSIIALQEQNDARLIALAKACDEAMSKVGGLVLECIQDFLVDERVKQIVGEHNQLEMLPFRGATLRPSTYQNPGYRALVRVESFSQIPSSRGQMQQFVQAMTALGYLVPGRDDRKVLRMWGLGTEDIDVDEDRVDEAGEMHEIDLWKQGQVPDDPAKTDNHQVRIEVMRRWMVSPPGKQWAAANPQLAALQFEHLQKHMLGAAEDALRPKYEMQLADMLLRAEYIARAGKIDPTGELAHAMQAQAGIAAAAQPVPQGGPPSFGKRGPMQKPGDQQQGPPNGQMRPPQLPKPDAAPVAA